MEACVGAHNLSRRLNSLGHDARLMPAKYIRPYTKGQKIDFNDAEAIAAAVQRPMMKFVATKTADRLDLQALHRVENDWSRSAPASINNLRARCVRSKKRPVPGRNRPSDDDRICGHMRENGAGQPAGAVHEQRKHGAS